jgi:hypothetical protein
MATEVKTRTPASSLPRFVLKSCQRCNGDLVLDDEGSERGAPIDYVCIQCGRRHEVASQAGILAVVTVAQGAGPAVRLPGRRMRRT